jgi:hypothetical protein
VSAFADGASHTVIFKSTTTGQAVTFNLDDVSLTGGGISLPPTTQTAVFGSMGIYDGLVLEYSEISGKGGSINSAATYFVVGDNAADKQYRSILHFNTSVLPDKAVITSVTLMLKKQGVVGTDPFSTHGNLLADIRKPYFGGTAYMEIGDFQAAASLANVTSFNSVPVDNWYSALLGTSSYAFVNLTGSTQFRLRFAVDDNDDLSADYVSFFSGNYATASLRPQLIVQYYVP